MGINVFIGKREIDQDGSDGVNGRLEDYNNVIHSRYEGVRDMIRIFEDVMGIKIPEFTDNPIFIKITPDIIEHVHQYALINKLDDEYEDFAVYWIPYAFQKYGDQAYVLIK